MPSTDLHQRLLHPGIIAIIRANSSEGLVEAAEALAAGGVTAMEVTMTTPGALEAIRAIADRQGSQILIGVGSIIDSVTAEKSFDAGAQFVVTPVTKVDVIQTCNRHGRPIACGAFTPTEALLAHESGADFIKIFPADLGGPAYIKSLLAPLPMLRIIPTGGVTPETAQDFLKAGSVALGVGSGLVSNEILKKQDWAGLKARAEQFVAAAKRS